MISPNIKLGRVYAWDPTRQDPDNPLAVVAVSREPHEIIGVDAETPRLRRAPDWGSARYGMLGVEIHKPVLARYERAVLDGGTEWRVLADYAVDYGVDMLDRLERLQDDHPEIERPSIEVPPREGLRLVVFRSVEVLQAYSGWLWAREAK